MSPDPTPSVVALEVRGLTKRFGIVVACDEVDLVLRRGEIHGILGENGAGKSTLMKMLLGLVLPDAGSISIDGRVQRIVDPQRAAALGIAMVHQHFSIVEAFTVWENIALGESGALDRDATRSRIRAISERYGLEVDPDSVVRDLSAGMRQRVEIIKCLSREPRILILDEPTSVLTPAESERLFTVLRDGAVREGWAVALVSHKLDEVLHATDRITVMRHGRVVHEVMTVDVDAASLARDMVGRPVTLRTASAAIGAATAADLARDGIRSVPRTGAPMLDIVAASARGTDGRVLLAGLSLAVHPGEIVGVAGVEGNGQEPLSMLLSSLLPLDAGTVSVGGSAVRSGKPGAMMRAGVAVIPADRHLSGCVLEMSVADNLVLTSIEKYSSGGVVDRDEITKRAAELIEEFAIDVPGPASTTFGVLSGGNQQRVVLARALSEEPRVLVAVQPTRGLDVGAVEYIGGRLQRAAADSIAVLLISTDLAELAALADRIVVLYRGSVVGEMARSEFDTERLGLLMGGGGSREAAS